MAALDALLTLQAPLLPTLAGGIVLGCAGLWAYAAALGLLEPGEKGESRE